MWMKVPDHIPSWLRPVYVMSSTVLGVVLSFGLHAVIELWYLSYAQAHGWMIHWTKFFGLGWCALPVWLQYTLPVFGLLYGYWQGTVWYRWVYVERQWEKKIPPVSTS